MEVDLWIADLNEQLKKLGVTAVDANMTMTELAGKLRGLELAFTHEPPVWVLHANVWRGPWGEEL